MIRAAVMGTAQGGRVLGSTLEHPATVSACKRWAEVTGKEYIAIPHNIETASVSAEDYQRYLTPDTRVATIIQTSPVTGRLVDVPAVVKAIRKATSLPLDVHLMIENADRYVPWLW